MSTLVKLIIATCLSMITDSNRSETLANNPNRLAVTEFSRHDSVKERAFEILTAKCNVCHGKRNRRWVFTEDNMNGRSGAVYTQVFIKKRMPKGKKIRLTTENYQDLLTWISSLKNDQNGNQL